MPTVDFLPVATGGGALVDPQVTFIGSTYQTSGFQVGIAQPAQVNKVLRQSSFMVAAIANFMANILGINILDDGNLATATTNFTNAVRNGSAKLVAVAFGATPIFDASTGNVFEITLTGNVTSSTIPNILPGQSITMIIHQDATGGRTFVPPVTMPLADIGAAVNQTSVQKFVVNAAGSALYPVGPLTLS